MRPELPTAVAVDNSASIQPARSIFISWGKSVQISGATSHRTLGGILGMFSGVFVLLAASSIINLSEWRNASWWKNTAEAEVTHFILQSMKSSVNTP